MNLKISEKKLHPPENLRLWIDKRELYSHEVVMLVANVNYTTVYLSSGKALIVAKTLKRFDEELSQYGFIRVHKSAIINPAYVTNYSHPEIRLANGLVAKVSRRRKLN